MVVAVGRCHREGDGARMAAGGVLARLPTDGVVEAVLTLTVLERNVGEFSDLGMHAHRAQRGCPCHRDLLAPVGRQQDGRLAHHDPVFADRDVHAVTTVRTCPLRIRLRGVIRVAACGDRFARIPTATTAAGRHDRHGKRRDGRTHQDLDCSLATHHCRHTSTGSAGTLTTCQLSGGQGEITVFSCHESRSRLPPRRLSHLVNSPILWQK